MSTLPRQDSDTTPESLEAMGYTLEGYSETKYKKGSGYYSSPRLSISQADVVTPRDTRVLPTCFLNGQRCDRNIDCTGVELLCRAADGVLCKAAKLRVKQRPVARAHAQGGCSGEVIRFPKR